MVIFGHLSDAQLSPEATLKSDKGLHRPQREETTHLMCSAQTSPHKLDFRNRSREHIMGYLRMTHCGKRQDPHFNNCQSLLPLPQHAKKKKISSNWVHDISVAQERGLSRHLINGVERRETGLMNCWYKFHFAIGLITDLMKIYLLLRIYNSVF